MPGNGAPQQDDEADDALRPREPGTFVYDEWDYQARAYKPRWCLVKEHTLDEGEPDCFNDALRRHSALLDDVKRHFEAILPEGFDRISRLTDGEDLDLNAALEAFADLRMRVPPDDKIYWRRHKVRRDVAVLFLLDMSASTAEPLRLDRPGPSEPAMPGPRGAASRSKRRIIDLEKDSIALLMQALDAIGDTYGIYGFSGYGRDGVDFYVIKDLAERFDNRIKRRLDRVTPRHATRMGAAIRHAVSKLAPQAAATKILLLLSDGRPQDRGYSRQGTEKGLRRARYPQGPHRVARQGHHPLLPHRRQNGPRLPASHVRRHRLRSARRHRHPARPPADAVPRAYDMTGWPLWKP